MSALEAYNAEDVNLECYQLADGSSDLLLRRLPGGAGHVHRAAWSRLPELRRGLGVPQMVEAFTNGSTAFLLQDPEVIAAVEQSSSARRRAVAPLVTGPGGKAMWPMATAGWGVAEASSTRTPP